MKHNFVEAIVLFPFELLNAFLTPFFFPSPTPAREWERTQVGREQPLKDTVKRLRHQLRAQRSAQRGEAEYLQRLLRDQADRHRKEVQMLEKRYRERYGRKGIQQRTRPR